MPATADLLLPPYLAGPAFDSHHIDVQITENLAYL